LLPFFGHSTDEVASRLQDCFQYYYNLKLEDYCNISIQDGAAAKTAEHLRFEKEVCEMHKADKVGGWMAGTHKRTRKKRPFDPFPEMEAIVDLHRNIAKEFSYVGKRRDQLERVCETERWYECIYEYILSICSCRCIHGHFFFFHIYKLQQVVLYYIFPVCSPVLRVKQDLCTTRIAAEHNLLFQNMRLSKGLQKYLQEGAAKDPDEEIRTRMSFLTPSPEQWRTTAEIEALLNSLRTVILQSQSQLPCISCYDIILIVRLIELFAPDTLIPVMELFSTSGERKLQVIGC